MDKDRQIGEEIVALLNYMLSKLGAKQLLKFLQRNQYLVDRYQSLKTQFYRKNQQCKDLYKQQVYCKNVIGDIEEGLNYFCRQCICSNSVFCNTDCKVYEILKIIEKGRVTTK